MQKRKQGDRFELLAWSWLEHKGYTLIEKNFARRMGEIDLIVQDPDKLTIVFVEVRFRSRDDFGGGVESIDFRKQRKLVRTANSWLQRFAHQRTSARIDIIAIKPASQDTPTELNWCDFEIIWIKNAVEE